MGGKGRHEKKVSQKVSYEVKLFIAAKPRNRSRHMYDIEKLDPSTGKYKPVEDNEDLLSIQAKDLRLIIEDNAGDGDPVTGSSALSRGEFYANNRLVKVLNVFVPLRIEVRKFVGQSKDPAPVKGGEVEAMFEIIDPPEDTSNIKGPGPHGASPITGKGFIENFIKAVKPGAGSSDDNCIRDFATPPFDSRCRISGDKVTASDVLYNRRREPLPADPSNEKRAMVRIRASKQTKGVAKVFFHPPPVLGDSYQLKITINNVKGQAMLLRDDTGGECAHFQTPTVTVWKKVKIHMVVCQEGVDYGGIKWDEVINAYRDAFIHIEEPEAERRFEISEDEWIKYLDRFVYGPGNILSRNWRRNIWKIYRTVKDASYYDAAAAAKWIHLRSYCFPQQCDYAYKIRKGDTLSKIARRHGMTWQELYKYEDARHGKSNVVRLNEQKNAKGRPPKSIDNPNLIYPDDIVMIPMRLTPSDDDDPTSWDLLDLLARRTVQDKLEVPWRRFRETFRGRRIGLCVLLVKLPSETSDVGGMHSGGKLFYMVRSGDVTNTFTHEMGHALFLNHGVTQVVRATQNPGAHPLQADASFAVRSEEGGSEGPYLDQHYSEDMIPCVMSYNCDYYDSNGNILADTDHPLHFNHDDHPTDWHFCGVCLLQLRFYDEERMLSADNDSFRRLQYRRKPIVAAKAGGPVITPSGKKLRNIGFPNSLTVKKGRIRTLFILYPQEGVMDNYGRDLYKDICHLTKANIAGGHPRAEWKSTDSNVAEVIVRKKDNVWLSILRGKNPGRTTITFEIRYGSGVGDVVKSDPVNVTVTA